MAETDTPATIRANHNSRFYTRFLVMGIGAAAGAGWFYYDGAYKWPLLAERYRVYQELVESGRGGEWDEVAEQRGWSAELPEEDHNYSAAAIQLQFVFSGIFAIASAVLLLKVLLARGRWIESDGERIATSWGQTVPYESVVKINKRRWQRQGIAYVEYRDGDRTRRFVLDDFKFHRKPTDAILYQMEQAVGVERITGGSPEVDPNAAAEHGDEAAPGAGEGPPDAEAPHGGSPHGGSPHDGSPHDGPPRDGAADPEPAAAPQRPPA